MVRDMGFTEGMMYGMATRAEGKKMKTLDWDKLAEMIKERKAEHVVVGLGEDWCYTSGTVLKKGLPTKSYVYLSSHWATPTAIIDGDEVECYFEGDEKPYDENTIWPDKALEILGFTKDDIRAGD